MSVRWRRDTHGSRKTYPTVWHAFGGQSERLAMCGLWMEHSIPMPQPIPDGDRYCRNCRRSLMPHEDPVPA